MNNEQHRVWVDYVRVFATFGVVFLHAAAPLLENYNELHKMNWWVGNLYDSAVRVCVPLFFMISGYLLLEKHDDLKLFFRKRVKKVAVPLLAWSLIYILWKAGIGLTPQLSAHAFYSILISPSYYHLWFLYAIIGLYFFVPILRVFVSNSGSEMLNYYVLLWFFAVSLIPLMENLAGSSSSIDLLSISGFSGYLILGFLLGNHHGSAWTARASAMIFIACFFLTSVGTYLLTDRNAGIFSDYFYGYQSPNVIIASAAAFIFLKHLIEKNNIFHRPFVVAIVSSLSSASLGIYLVHVMFLYFLSVGSFGFVLNGFVGSPVYSIPLTAVTSFVFSYMTILIMKKIPLIKKMVP